MVKRKIGDPAQIDKKSISIFDFSEVYWKSLAMSRDIVLKEK